MTAQTDIQANLPLTEATFFILLSLASEPKHGYAIMKEVQTLSQNRIALSTGTLYGTLKRLLAQSWIERADETEQTATASAGNPDRPRKSYILTSLGRRVLNAEIARLQNLVTVAQLRTAGGPA
jgi:DNA-binding PadR family transcriptional regulator